MVSQFPYFPLREPISQQNGWDTSLLIMLICDSHYHLQILNYFSSINVSEDEGKSRAIESAELGCQCVEK